MNLWTVFARAYFISCALGAQSPDGGQITTHKGPFANELAALRHATVIGGFQRRDEPVWHDKGVWRKVMDDLQTNVNPRVAAAVSYRTTLFSDLPPCRNFFAHRSQGTYRKITGVARRHGIDPSLHPADVLASHRTGGFQPLLADWLDDLYAIIETLAIP